jgi:ABC-2 type transport system ATP-binding protein
LPEVEMTCNRVIIIHRGKILASDTPEHLTKTLQGGGAVNVEVRAPVNELSVKLRALEVIEKLEVKEDEDGWVRATAQARAGTDPREAIFKLAAGNGWTLRELSRTRTTLEDIFVQVTREEDEAEEERREGRRSLLR